MTAPEESLSTCWLLIEEASAGRDAARRDFAARYLDVVRSYLAGRWQGTPLLAELDDAVQEVFLECFRRGGVLDRVGERPPDSFRAFLFGVARNVARRQEKRRALGRAREVVANVETEPAAADEATPSRVFDQAWAKAIFAQAAEVQRARAEAADAGARRRVELLELRARDGLAVRDIARRWGEDAAVVHKQYARAREEFRAALESVLSFHYPGLSARDIDEKCRELTQLLGA